MCPSVCVPQCVCLPECVCARVCPSVCSKVCMCQSVLQFSYHGVADDLVVLGQVLQDVRVTVGPQQGVW